MLTAAAGDTGLFHHPASGTVPGVLGDGRPFLVTGYRRIKGNPVEAARELLSDVLGALPADAVSGIRVTGSGGRLLSTSLGATAENEFKAIARAVGTLHPDIPTVFEMGGETSKFIELEVDRDTGRVGIADYQTNGDCAAGTGSFMDQQANRLLYNIEDVGDIVCGAGKAASVAGRCSVFAKSDMIHAQQKGYQPPEVLKGLCNAVIRNYRGTIAKGKSVGSKVAFIGGVAANKGAVDALREAFDLEEERLVIPDYYAWMGALGAALLEADAYRGPRAHGGRPLRPGARTDRGHPRRRPAHDGPRDPAARPGEALRLPRRRRHRCLPGCRRRFRLHQPGGDRHRRRGDEGDLPEDRRPAGRSGQQGPGRDLGRDGAAPQHQGRGHHRVGSRTHRRAHGRRHGERRDHRPQDRGHVHRAEAPGQSARHDLRDRGPGLQVHQPQGRRGGRFRHERSLRRRHRLVPGGAGGEARHPHHRRVRRSGAVGRRARAAGRALHRVHGARRQLVPAARRDQARRGGRPGLLHRVQLPQPSGRRSPHRRDRLLPGRHRLQRLGGGRLQHGPRPGDHRAAPQRRRGRHRHGPARPGEDGGHRHGVALPGLGSRAGRLHHPGVHLPGVLQRVRHPPVHHRRREDLLGRQVLRPLPEAGQGGQDSRHRRPRGTSRATAVLVRDSRSPGAPRRRGR